MDPMMASIMIFAGNFAPRGWLFCDGQLLSINQNSALFSLLGTTYGGDGRTTFGLPDLRGRAAIGPRHGPGLSNYVLGQRGGVETVTLNITQIPSHTHLASVAPGAAHIPVNTTDGDADSTSPAAGVLANTGDDLYTTSAPNGTYPEGAPVTGTTVTNLPTGGNQWHTNIQPFLAINYIIATVGFFPSRS
ncbi:phage tail protein [Pseudotenacibaculum haliotis]|uniref:Phage tail protein n=1 Tax=Pseudotenacibaculum haliotis TaxID=1862138 RepID=A0ABW5LPR4_9FLAO